MTFANASSAARQQRTTANNMNGNSPEEDDLRRGHRAATRTRPEQDRSRRFGGDLVGDLESRPRFTRARDSVDADDDRSLRFQKAQSASDDANGQQRRNGTGRGGKFDQPWLRGVSKDVEESAAGDSKLEWRASRTERSSHKNDDNPEWERPSELGAAASRGGPKSSKDFQAWMEQMKAKDPSSRAEDSSVPQATPQESDATIPTEGVPLNLPKALFGIYGADDSDDPVPNEAPQPKQGPTKKPKASRFAKMFQPSEVHPPGPDPAPEATIPMSPAVHQPSPVHDRSSSTTEDRTGFENMMRMLMSSRVSGSSSQAPTNPLFGPPKPTESTEPRSNRSSLGAPSSQRRSGSPTLAERPQSIPTPPSQPVSRPQTQNRDSEFLLHLMKSAGGPRTPFTEAQIYGQSYRRKTPEDALQPAGFAGPSMPPPGANMRGPPPGFFENQQGPPGVLDPRLSLDAQARHLNYPARQEPPVRRGQEPPSAKDQNMPGLPPMDHQFPPPGLGPNFNGRQSSPERGRLLPGVPPPPGFGTPRNILPPGYQFPPGYPPHLQQAGPGRPANMIPPQSGLNQGMNPSGPFYGGPVPPGFAPPGPPPPPQGNQGRTRPPSGSIPSGFDMYGGGPGMGGRGMAPPPGGEFAQYLKQMHAGAYQGM